MAFLTPRLEFETVKWVREHVRTGDEPSSLIERSLEITCCYFSAPAIMPTGVHKASVKAHCVEVFESWKIEVI
jgi:hypothetical protein